MELYLRPGLVRKHHISRTIASHSIQTFFKRLKDASVIVVVKSLGHHSIPEIDPPTPATYQKTRFISLCRLELLRLPFWSLFIRINRITPLAPRATPNLVLRGDAKSGIHQNRDEVPTLIDTKSTE